jgi:hypothetical protein
MNSFERELTKAIDYTVNCGPAWNANYRTYGSSGFLRVHVRSDKKDKEYKFEFWFKDPYSMRIRSWVYIDTDGYTPYWTELMGDAHFENIPCTEEEYFQASTVQDLTFSLKFFQYLREVLHIEVQDASSSNSEKY